MLVPEMNAGQLALELDRLMPDGRTVSRLNRIDGEPIEPHQILTRIEELST